MKKKEKPAIPVTFLVATLLIVVGIVAIGDYFIWNTAFLWIKSSLKPMTFPVAIAISFVQLTLLLSINYLINRVEGIYVNKQLAASAQKDLVELALKFKQ